MASPNRQPKGVAPKVAFPVRRSHGGSRETGRHALAFRIGAPQAAVEATRQHAREEGMGMELDPHGRDFIGYVSDRVERTSHWVREARRQPDPVAWANSVAGAAKSWVSQSELSSERTLAMRLEIEDLQWAILTGIATSEAMGSDAPSGRSDPIT